MTPAAGVAIALSAVLGLLVSLSTFLVIGATSSLSYNVIGHVKTVIILTGDYRVLATSQAAALVVSWAAAVSWWHTDSPARA